MSNALIRVKEWLYTAVEKVSELEDTTVETVQNERQWEEFLTWKEHLWGVEQLQTAM